MRVLGPVGLVLLALSASVRAQESAPDLPIGDATRRDRHVSVVLDGVTDTTSGEVITPGQLAQRLDGVRLLFVGENHTSQEFHDVQLRVLQELQKRGRRILVGLEMYPYTEQRWLDEWNARSLTEQDFVSRSQWYGNWGYHWNYYRDIFFFARDHSVRLHGVNVPRSVVQTARAKGLDALDAQARAYLPARIDIEHAEHRKLFRAFFGDGDSLHAMTETQWEGLYRAQCTWDAAMGYGAVKALEQDGHPTTIAVVLIGAGHVAYGLGAERQAALWFKERTASLIPVPVADDRGAPTPPVRASYANYLWGVLPEPSPRYPTLGLSLSAQKDGQFYKVIGVSPNSAARAAGFVVGDALMSLDDTPLADVETLNRLIADKRWGDEAVFRVRRQDTETTLRVALRRTVARAEGAR